MKNKEYYKDQILELAYDGYSIAVNSETHKPYACISCGNCIFKHTESCTDALKEWLEQEHNEPLLNDAERQYLEAVIRPFKDRAIGVTKYKFSNDYAWLYIDVAGVTESTFDGFSLPAFRKDSAYLDMKFDKEYTLKDLGLFEDETARLPEKINQMTWNSRQQRKKIAKAIKRHNLLIEARRALEAYQTNK